MSKRSPVCASGSGLPLARPVGEVTVKSMVGHQVDMIDFGNGFELIDEVIEYGLTAHFEQGFGKVLGERKESRGIAGGKDNGFHRMRAPSSG